MIYSKTIFWNNIRKILYFIILTVLLPLTSCGFSPSWRSTDAATIGAWMHDSIDFTIPYGYEAKHGYNFLKSGVKIKIMTVLPISENSPKGKIPPDMYTAFEVIICPDVIDTPELGGSYYYHRMKYDLGRPSKKMGGDTIPLMCGGKMVEGRVYEWNYNRTTIVRYQVFPNDDLQVVAVGPKKIFDESAFYSLLGSIHPDYSVKF